MDRIGTNSGGDDERLGESPGCWSDMSSSQPMAISKMSREAVGVAHVDDGLEERRQPPKPPPAMASNGGRKNGMTEGRRKKSREQKSSRVSYIKSNI